MTTIDYLEYKDAKKWDPNHWRLDPKIPRKRKHPRTRLRKCGCDDDADSSATSTTTTNAANQNNITNSVATSSPVTIA